MKLQSIRLEERPDVARAPPEHLLQDRHHHARRIVAEQRGLRDARQLFVLGDRNRIALAVVDVQHHVDVRAAIPDIDRSIRSDPELVLQLLDDGDLAVTGRHSFDGAHFTGVVVVLELGAKDVVWSNDPGERGLYDLAGRRRDDEERESMPVDAAFEQVHERRQVAPQTHATARFLEVLAPDAAELGVVANQIRELAALVDHVAARETVDLFLESRCADQLAQHGSRIVEAERLIEVRRDEKVLRRRGCRKHGTSLRQSGYIN